MPISLSRRLVYCLFFIFLSFVCVIRFPSPTSAQSSVVIGEVQWAGSEASSADEWIELWNQSSTPFPLHTFRLRGVGGGADIFFSPTDIIEPQSAFLIANYHASDTKSTLAFEAQIVTTTLSINNEDSKILLLDANGNTVDEAAWGRLAPGGTTGSPRRSMLRTNTSTSTWGSASSTRNLDSLFVQYGTPGICDDCSSTNIPTPPPAGSPSEPLIELDEEMIDPLILENLLPVEQPPSALTQATLDDLQEMLETALAEELLDTPPSATSTDAQSELLQPLLNIAEATSSSPLTETQLILTESLPIVFPQQVTTTDSLSASLPTIDSAPILPETTTTLITSTSTTVITPTPTISLNVETPYVAPVPASPLVHFNELLVATSKPSEWIELATEALSSPAALYGWSIRDAKHTILTFGPTTVFTWNPETQLLVLTFVKGKLLDKGAEIFLVTNAGITVDTISFPAQTKDQSFARTTRAGAAWKKTNILTPGQENLFPSSIPVTKTSAKQVIKKDTPVKAKAAPPKTTIKTTAPKKQSVSKLTPQKNIRTIESVSLKNNSLKTSSIKSTTSSSSTKKKATPSKKASAKKATPKKKTTSSSKTAAPQPVTIQDLSSMYVSRRVVLSGTVATLPRLLGSNAFILQTDDGRGLYVYGNTKQASPPFRARVELAGTISVTDDGLALHMYAADRWRILDLDHPVQTRVPDLLSPGSEDGWSYVTLQGTVVDAKATKIAILHDDIHLEVSIRPLLQYRPERLQKGDVIEVTGILDTRKDIPVVIPRLAEEIRLIKNAPLKTAAATSHSPFPNWVPIGVAGASIAVTQGARRYWYHRQEKQLRVTAKTMNQLPSIKT